MSQEVPPRRGTYHRLNSCDARLEEAGAQYILNERHKVQKIEAGFN